MSTAFAVVPEPTTNVAHVYKAINEVTAAMAIEGIGKTQDNKSQGYRFRGIDDVYNALAKHLAAAKLCMLPRVRERSTVERPTNKGGVSTYTTLLIDFDLISAVDGSKHTITTVGEASDTADKSSNKAMSAAMKYACFLAFQIPTEGDNDADASHIERAPSAPNRTAKAQPPPPPADPVKHFERRFRDVVARKGTVPDLRKVGADIARSGTVLDEQQRGFLESVYLSCVDEIQGVAS